MKNNLNNKIFIILLCVILSIISFKLILNSNEENYIDNRSSYKFNFPTIKQILSNEYQDRLEETIADQMPLYNYFKLSYLKISNYVNIKTVQLFKLDKLSKYINFKDINLFNGYLLYTPTKIEEFIESSNDDIEEINNICENTNADIYFYFIETDSDFNFEINYKTKSFEYLKSNLKIKSGNISYLNITDFDTYKDLFYTMDHHWNHKGSYKGYVEIANLMHFNNIINIKDEICFYNISSYGSKTKNIAGIKLFNEDICLYDFDFPRFEIYVSGEKADNYGESISNLQNYSEISYGAIYGSDFDEIIFINNNNSNGRKLLVYSNSYSNAINKLLASNYKETYIIDGRYYSGMSMVDYINNKGIDDVLILANSMLFDDNINW